MKNWTTQKPSIIALAVLCFAHCARGDLLENGGADTGTTQNWSGLISVFADDAASGSMSFKFDYRPNVQMRSKALMPVDRTRALRVAASVKNNGTNPIPKVFIALAAFDAAQEEIRPWNVAVIQGTETTLVEPCNPGDQVIRIKDGSRWKADKNSSVAFAVDESGGLSDLPNRNTSAGSDAKLGISAVEDKGSYWEVTLEHPCGVSYSAETAVRQHTLVGSYMIAASREDLQPGEDWQVLEGQLAPSEPAAVGGAFWPGTEYAQVLLWVQDSGEGTLLVDDVVVEQVD